MKYAFLLIAALLSLAGCDGANQVEPYSSPAPIANDQLVASRTTNTTPDSDSASDQPSQFEFNLSDAATTRVRAAMESVPDATHLIVSVDVDDEKHCTGFHYNLQFEANPSNARYAMAESNGIKLAIEKDDLRFLVVSPCCVAEGHGLWRRYTSSFDELRGSTCRSA